MRFRKLKWKGKEGRINGDSEIEPVGNEKIEENGIPCLLSTLFLTDRETVLWQDHQREIKDDYMFR
jgi:hypothetical protein